MKKILALILVIVMIASCFAGCKGKSVTIGYEEAEPFIYEDEETGELVGFDVELAQAVFQEMGYSVNFQKMGENEDIYAKLSAGDIDCIWRGLNTEEASVQTDIETSFPYASKDGMQLVVGFLMGSDLVEGVNNALKKLAEEGFTTELAKKYEEHNFEAVIDFSAAAANAIVVGYAAYEPLSYKDAEQKLVGFDIELATAVFEGMGYTVTFKEISLDNKYTLIDSGLVDCIWSGFSLGGADPDEVAPADKVSASYKYLKNPQVVVVKADSGIKTAADLVDKEGCAWYTSPGEQYLLTLECAMPWVLDSQQDCLTQVKYGTYGFAVVDEHYAKSYCAKEENADLMILEDLTSDTDAFVVPFLSWRNKADNPDAMVNKVNAQLEVLAANGTIAKLAEKYGLSEYVITDFADQKK